VNGTLDAAAVAPAPRLTPHGAELWLGAPARGGLALPSASPSESTLYAPRGVHLDENLLVVADSGNHRVLLWRGVPNVDHSSADLVLGQPNAHTEGPAAAGRGPENGFHLPTGVLVHDGRLWVADAWHHRILVWDRVPERSDEPPSWALGQDDLSSVAPNRGRSVAVNRGRSVAANGLYWPYGLGFVDGVFYVADTGNRRVLAWEGLPTSDRPADAVLGQPDFASSDENRGAEPGPRSFRWPHAIAGIVGAESTLLVADAGDHRVLGWRGGAFAARGKGGDRDADFALGQQSLTATVEFPYAPQSATTLRFPYALASDGRVLAVADTANNRILLWDKTPLGTAAAADRVIGQDGFNKNGENRWQAVRHDTLCWPYGIALSGGRLAVADSGNNRVVVWRIE
jgi:NHL repeat